jgi:uncharacterized Zn finger protein (UPF0148 family)
LASRDRDVVKRMSEALKAGGKMLAETCPVCGNPLFEIKGEMRCVSCDKPVVVVRDQTESGRALLPAVLSSIENIIIEKLDELSTRLASAVEVKEIEEIAEALDSLLALLMKSEELAKMVRRRE